MEGGLVWKPNLRSKSRGMQCLTLGEDSMRQCSQMATLTSPSWSLLAVELVRSLPRMGGMCVEYMGVLLSIVKSYYTILFLHFLISSILQITAKYPQPPPSTQRYLPQITKLPLSATLSSEFKQTQHFENDFGQQMVREARKPGGKKEKQFQRFIEVYINWEFAMRSLEEFSTEGESIFKDAKDLPSFFKDNLLNPARVVKVFRNDPQANIRIFYYQYLKLCFNPNSVKQEGYVSKINKILNNEAFRFIFPPGGDLVLYNDQQFKYLIIQFFKFLGSSSKTVEEALSRYPIMDTVMIYFFRSMLILTDRTDSLDSYIDSDQLLQYLCSYFGVELSLHGKCIQFVDTDIFVFEEDPKQVFMAYLNDTQQIYSQVQPVRGNALIDLQAKDESLLAKVEGNIHQHSNHDYSNISVSNWSRPGDYQVNNISTYTHGHEGFQQPVRDISTRDNQFQVDPSMSHNQYDLESIKQTGLGQSPASNFTQFMHQYNNRASTPSNPYVSPSSNLSTKTSTYQSLQYGQLSSLTPTYQSSSYQKGLSNNLEKLGSNTLSLAESNKLIDVYKYSSLGGQKDGASTHVYTPDHQQQMLGSKLVDKTAFGLNVSLEFTNSFIMKMMPQPHKSSVYNSRQRARQFRNSIKGFLI